VEEQGGNNHGSTHNDAKADIPAGGIKSPGGLVVVVLVLVLAAAGEVEADIAAVVVEVIFEAVVVPGALERDTVKLTVVGILQALKNRRRESV